VPAQVRAVFRVEGDVEQPAIVAEATHLREREQDLLAEVLVVDSAEERAQEVGVLLRAALSEPEDRLLADVLGRIRAFRQAAKQRLGSRRVVLVQRMDGLRAEVHVRRRSGDRLESLSGSLGANLTHPEDRLLADRSGGIVVQDVQQYRLGLRRSLLRQEEHGLLAQRDGAFVSLLQYLLDDRERALRIHLEQRIHRRGADVVVVVIANARTVLPRGARHGLGGLHIASLGEHAADANRELARIGDRRRAWEAPLLRVQCPERFAEIVLAPRPVEREGAPVRSVGGVFGARMLVADLGEEPRGAAEVAAVDGFASEAVERVGRVCLGPGRRRNLREARLEGHDEWLGGRAPHERVRHRAGVRREQGGGGRAEEEFGDHWFGPQSPDTASVPGTPAGTAVRIRGSRSLFSSAPSTSSRSVASSWPPDS